MNEPIIGYLDSNSDYSIAHQTAKEPCKRCKKPLGYNRPLACIEIKGGWDIYHQECYSQHTGSDTSSTTRA